MDLTGAANQAVSENYHPNLSPDLCLESFESFLQDLAPVRLSEDTPNSAEPIQKVSLNAGASDLLSREGGGVGDVVNRSPEDEIKRLHEIVELLQVRLDAIQKVLEIQEQEVCSEMGNERDQDAHSTYVKLLGRWRREVCIMLLKQRVDALQVEQRQLQHTQKEQHLAVQLHEARALVEVLKQERNSQAEVAILTASTKVAELTMKGEVARRQHEMDGTLKAATSATAEAIGRVVESHFDIMSLQLERISDASCRLDMHGKRLFFAEHQVAMAAGVINSELQPQGGHLYWRNGEIEHNHMDRRRDRTVIEQQTVLNQAGRAHQLEVLLAATKTQLADECLHARELQERLVKSEAEARESVKRVSKKAQEQADRDLAAIKRQHVQAMQSLQQKLVKFQAEQTKSIVVHHQLEHKLSQQQQEFTHTLNQRDLEWKKSLDAKEAEVNGLLDEQNALLVKLKKFWRPILSSSSARIFNEKNSRKSLHMSQESSRSQDMKIEDCKRNICMLKSVETQTDEVIGKKEHHSEVSTEDTYQGFDSPHHRLEMLQEMNVRVPPSPSLSTPSKRSRQSARAKKNDDDLILSYLTKLQKSYGKSHVSTQFANSQSPDSLLLRAQEANSLPTTSTAMVPAHSEGRVRLEAPYLFSMESRESSDCNLARPGNVPRYIICVPHRESRAATKNSSLEARSKNKLVRSKNLLLESWRALKL